MEVPPYESISESLAGGRRLRERGGATPRPARVGGVLLGAATLAASLVVASPAQAQTTTCDAGDPCPTTVTFEVQAGALTITVPDASTLGTATPAGGTITDNLGTVTVNDQRASPTPTWTATVLGTNFTTGGGDDPGEVVPIGSVTYTTGTMTPGAGQTGTCNALLTTTALTVTAQDAATHTGGTGNNSCSWDPSLVVTLATTNVAGTYTGTITHSVTPGVA
ncbi:hypothetical protein AB0J86_11385 [Micromonospora sp. NPDC049559]|uniref:hypothetical protein n=1 Tax=Micromonospora sp. NPDC049559 TaxID=3155923 RepID=UPI00342D7196